MDHVRNLIRRVVKRYCVGDILSAISFENVVINSDFPQELDRMHKYETRIKFHRYKYICHSRYNKYILLNMHQHWCYSPLLPILSPDIHHFTLLK